MPITERGMAMAAVDVRQGVAGKATQRAGDPPVPMADLVAGLRRRDPDVLETVVAGHADRLYRAARGMGFDGPTAEDLVQDVFVVFLNSLDRFEGRSQLSTWLFGILHHKAQERRRSAGREDATDHTDEAFEALFTAAGLWVSPPVGPDRATASGQIAAALAACLEGLQSLQREVFHLRTVEGLSALDVGTIIGATANHVGVVLHRAHMRLRCCLEGRGWGRA